LLYDAAVYQQFWKLLKRNVCRILVGITARRIKTPRRCDRDERIILKWNLRHFVGVRG
jgi:hypothetical protein